MKRELINTFKRRSFIFLEIAEELIKKGHYDLAMVNIEQALQLSLKAKLLELEGKYLYIYQITRLLKELLNKIKNNELERIFNENYEILKRIEDAYILGRYYIGNFEKEEAIKSIKIAREILKEIWKE